MLVSPDETGRRRGKWAAVRDLGPAPLRRAGLEPWIELRRRKSAGYRHWLSMEPLSALVGAPAYDTFLAWQPPGGTEAKNVSWPRHFGEVSSPEPPGAGGSAPHPTKSPRCRFCLCPTRESSRSGQIQPTGHHLASLDAGFLPAPVWGLDISPKSLTLGPEEGQAFRLPLFRASTCRT
jgi:hypothetical protein